MFFPRFDGFDPDNTYLRISTNKTRLQCLSSTTGNSHLQYIPRNMHTVFALLCFVVVIHWLIFPYPSGLLHWHCDNLTIVPVPAKQPWWIWINTSCEFIMNDCITTTKQNTTKPCAYFLGYTVCGRRTQPACSRSIYTGVTVYGCVISSKRWFLPWKSPSSKSLHMESNTLSSDGENGRMCLLGWACYIKDINSSGLSPYLAKTGFLKGLPGGGGYFAKCNGGRWINTFLIKGSA